MTWKNEIKFGIKEKKFFVIADATFISKDKIRQIIEVDHTQKMSKNRAKVEKYKKLMEHGVFDKPPKFIWITTTELRRKQITELCEGLDFQIFTVKDFH